MGKERKKKAKKTTSAAKKKGILLFLYTKVISTFLQHIAVYFLVTHICNNSRIQIVS